MAVIGYSRIPPLFKRGVVKYQWTGMAGNPDTGTPVTGCARYKTKSIQVEGTVTSVNIEGRNNPSGAWHILNDSRGEGNPLSFAAADTREILEDVDEIRPSVVTGTGVIVTLTMVG